MKYPHLAAQIFNVPLLVHPQKLDAIIAGLGERLIGGKLDAAAPDAAATLPAEVFSTRRGKRSDSGYTVTDGVGVVFASGALVHRTRFDMADSTYFLGYDTLASVLEAAMDDPDVHAVLQVMDSPGGQVAGAFEYGDRIHALRGKKPMWAIADDMAASAAYLSGSAFDKLAITSTGYAGSIGVVLRHVDFSRALANDGIAVTQIFAGAHKVDGNPYEPLPKAVQSDLQAEVDGIYAQFVEAVVRNRGLTADAVRATQAQTFRGDLAVQRGLADRVATTDQLITELAALRARSYPVGQSARSTASNQGGPMSGNTQGGQPAAQTPPVALTRESLQAEHPALFGALRTEFMAAGAAAELQRQKEVRAQALPGHEKLIEQLAADGKTSGLEAAQAVLAAERGAREAAAKAHANDAPPAAPSAAAPADRKGGKTKQEQATEASAYAKQHNVSFVEAMKQLGFAS